MRKFLYLLLFLPSMAFAQLPAVNDTVRLAGQGAAYTPTMSFGYDSQGNFISYLRRGTSNKWDFNVTGGYLRKYYTLGSFSNSRMDSLFARAVDLYTSQSIGGNKIITGNWGFSGTADFNQVVNFNNTTNLTGLLLWQDGRIDPANGYIAMKDWFLEARRPNDIVQRFYYNYAGGMHDDLVYNKLDRTFNLNYGDARSGRILTTADTVGGGVIGGNYKLKSDSTAATGYQTVGNFFPKGDTRYNKIVKKANPDTLKNWQFNGYGAPYIGTGYGSQNEGVLAYKTGTIYHAFRSATDAGHLDNSGKIVMRISQDSMKTWTAPVTIYDDPLTDDRNPAGEFFMDGNRLVIFIRKVTYTGGVLAESDWGFIYSDDVTTAGTSATWSSFNSLAPSVFPLGTAAYGKIVKVGNKGLISTYTGNRIARILQSTNGSTWTAGANIYDFSSSLTKKVTEPYLANAGNGNLLVVARNDDNGPYYQFKSTNSGTSFVDQGTTNTINQTVPVRNVAPVIVIDTLRNTTILLGSARPGTGARQNDSKSQLYISKTTDVLNSSTAWVLRDQITRPFPNNRNFYSNPDVAYLGNGLIMGVTTDGRYSDSTTVSRDLNKEIMYLYPWSISYKSTNSLAYKGIPDGDYALVYSKATDAFRLRNIQQAFAVDVTGKIFAMQPGELILNGTANSLTNYSFTAYGSDLTTVAFRLTGNSQIITPNLATGTIAGSGAVVRGTASNNLQIVPWATVFTNPAITSPTITAARPASTFQTPIGTAGTDSLVVKNGLALKAIPGNYYAPATRTITTTSPLTGGGDLSANRTFGLAGLTGLGAANQIIGMNAAATGYEYKSVTAGVGISVTQGVGSVTISASGNPVVEISGTSQAASGNTVYIPHNAAITTISIPTTTTIGTLYQVIGEGAGGWKLQLPTGAVAVGVGGFTTTSSGSLNSTDRYCTLTIRYAASNKFVVTTSQGTITPL